MNKMTPQVGTWYEDTEQRICFEVVAIDALTATIEAQMIDGEICEYDQDSWKELHLAQINEPEDWRNAYELSDEDRADPDDPFHPEDWSGPLNNIEPEATHDVLDDF